ncbi:MAG: c-type cytochrome [Litorilinea sp.]
MHHVVGRGRSAVCSILTRLLLVGAILGAGLAVFPRVAQPLHAQTPTSTPMPRAEPEPATDAPVPTAPPNAARGRAIYSQNCAACHGDTGLGDGPVAVDLPAPPPNFADPTTVADRTPAEWFLVTKHGRIEQMMPPWENRLSDQEIWHAVFYAWSLHLDENAIAEAELRYGESCATCHGDQGVSNDTGNDEAAASLPAFADPAYTIYQSPAALLAGWQNAHPEIGATWTPAQQRAQVEQLRAFSYITAWQPLLQPGSGVIEGQVQMGTAGEVLPRALEVRLEAYLDFEPVQTVTQTLASDGTFRFEALSLDPDVVYVAVTEYDAIQYSSPLLTLVPDAPVTTTQILLYTQTNDPTGLYIERVNWVVEPQAEGLVVGQILTFGFTGDRTYVGSQLAGVPAPVTVGVHVPPTAQDIRLENGVLGGRYHQQGNLIYDTVPIAPGATTHQLVVRYLMPIDAEPFTLRNEFIYPVNSLNLLVADIPEIEVAAAGLDDLGTQDFQGMDFRVWEGAELASGTVLVQFSGLNLAASNSGRVAILGPGVLFGMGGMVMLVLLTALTISWRQGRFQVQQSPENLAAQRTQLLQNIARLDDLHAGGALDEASWQRQRAQLKVEALAIDTRLRAQTQGPPIAADLSASPPDNSQEKTHTS